MIRRLSGLAVEAALLPVTFGGWAAITVGIKLLERSMRDTVTECESTPR